MGDCDDVLREMEPYLDRELSPELWEDVQSHLEGCLDCLHLFDFHAELRIVIARKCGHDPLPPGFLDRIQERVGRAELEDAEAGDAPPG